MMLSPRPLELHKPSKLGLYCPLVNASATSLRLFLVPLIHKAGLAPKIKKKTSANPSNYSTPLSRGVSF